MVLSKIYYSYYYDRQGPGYLASLLQAHFGPQLHLKYKYFNHNYANIYKIFLWRKYFSSEVH